MTFFGPDLRNGLPIGLGSVAGFGIAPRFSPSSLFAGGTVQGAWYDPSDLTTLFQDSAGTTPVTAVEQPVGLMLDNRSTPYSVFFDGTGDYLNTAISSAFAFGTGDFALSAFIYPTTTTGVQIIIDCRAGTSGNPGPVMYLNGSTLSSAKNSLTVVNSGGTVVANQWSFVELTRTSGSWRLFLNGSLVAGPTTDAINFTDNSAAYIAQNATTATQYFTGYIASARILKGVGGTTSVVPNSPLTAITGTSLLTCGTSWSGNPAITANGDARGAGLNPFLASPVGNHAYQTTSASRPTLRARYNLLTNSENFAGSGWSGTATVATDVAVAPDGTTTADSVTAGSTGTFRYVRRSPSALLVNVQFIWSVFAKKNTSDWVALRFWDTAPGVAAWFNLAAGTVGTVQSGCTASISDQGNGWYRCSITRTTGGTLSYNETDIQVSSGDNTNNATAGDSIFIWGAQLVPAAVFPSNTYQRVGAATDYATGAAFPPYLFFDGTDDSMLTNSVDFTGTDKMLVVAGVTKNSDAAAAILAELSANPSTNAGTFYLSSPESTGANGDFRFKSRGSLDTTPTTSGAYLAPTTRVLTGIGDIASDTAILRINGAQVVNTTSDQGTGNYGNYPLYIGRRNNATLPFNGNIYSLVIAGQSYSSGQISSTESWVAAKTPLGTI